MRSQPPMGGHLIIPKNDILYTYEPLMSSHLFLKGHFSCVTRVAAHSRFFCKDIIFAFKFSSILRCFLNIVSYPAYTPILLRALELWYHDPAVTTPVLKLFAELAQNRYVVKIGFHIFIEYFFSN